MYFEDYKKHKKEKFSTWLLWDHPTEGRIQWKSWRRMIVQRVVLRGAISDWYFILNKYGLDTVKKEILTQKWTPEYQNFISATLRIPKRKLKGYTKEQIESIQNRL